MTEMDYNNNSKREGMYGRAYICVIAVLIALIHCLAGVAVFKPSPYFGACD